MAKLTSPFTSASARLTPSVEAPAGRGDHINVGQTERWASALGGGLLTTLGLKRRTPGGLLLAALGSALLYRGATGHCPAFEQLDVNTADRDVTKAFRIDEAVTVAKSRDEVYGFWRKLENLPRFMRHLASVEPREGNRSHWVARTPRDIGRVAWDAEVTEDEPNERIVWRSLQGADVHNAGTVRFNDAPNNRGTEVHVTIEYRPPAGDVGAVAARLLTPAFSQMIKEDVRRFKQIMEAGEVPTIEGQPMGPR